jgi:phage repressor protein C with HTH and peptisase S24 domain
MTTILRQTARHAVRRERGPAPARGSSIRPGGRYLECPAVSDPDAFGLEVVGDSMLPEYRPGDVVVCSPSAPVRDGDDAWVIFLPPWGEGLCDRLKRVRFPPGGGVRIEPLNRRYDALTLAAGRVLRMVRVVARMPVEAVRTA